MLEQTLDPFHAGLTPDLVSDICKCGRFRSEHRVNYSSHEFDFARRCHEDDLDRWMKMFHVGGGKKGKK